MFTNIYEKSLKNFQTTQIMSMNKYMVQICIMNNFRSFPLKHLKKKKPKVSPKYRFSYLTRKALRKGRYIGFDFSTSNVFHCVLLFIDFRIERYTILLTIFLLKKTIEKRGFWLKKRGLRCILGICMSANKLTDTYRLTCIISGILANATDYQLICSNTHVNTNKLHKAMQSRPIRSIYQLFFIHN